MVFMGFGGISEKLRRKKALKALEGSQSTPLLTYVITAVAVTGGFLFGYNTAVVSGAFVMVRKDWPDVDDLWQSMLVAVTGGVAAVVALISGYVNEVFGRRPGLIISATLFVIGPVVCASAPHKEELLVGRVIVGIAIGFASASVPHYVAECSPPHIRGRLVTQFQLLITFGILIASIADAALYDLNRNDSWKWMMGIPAFVGLVQLIGILFLPESPRWLATHDKSQESHNVLLRITANSDIANAEFDEIMETHAESLAEKAQHGNRNLVVTMLTQLHLRKALLITGLLQMFQQLSGINVVMYYSTSILMMGGIKEEQAFWFSCITAAVNFIMTFVGLYLIEKIGRKMLLLLSSALVIFSLLVLGTVFAVISAQSKTFVQNGTLSSYYSLANDTSCYKYSDCDRCSYRENCGFCYDNANFGVCAPLNEQKDNKSCETYKTMSQSEQPWNIAVDFCPTTVSVFSIIGMVLYLCSFSIGMGPVPWTLTAETFPNFCRSAGVAFATAVNWTFNLIVSLTFLKLSTVVYREGVFFMYAAISSVGFVCFWLLLPETRGESLEKLRNLLKRPWLYNRSNVKFKWSKSGSGGHSASTSLYIKEGLPTVFRTKPYEG